MEFLWSLELGVWSFISFSFGCARGPQLPREFLLHPAEVARRARVSDEVFYFVRVGAQVIQLVHARQDFRGSIHFETTGTRAPRFGG